MSQNQFDVFDGVAVRVVVVALIAMLLIPLGTMSVRKAVDYWNSPAKQTISISKGLE
jgi:hypothetical protein